MAHPLSDTPTAAIPRLICATLAADNDLAGFFPTIAVADLAQFEEPYVPPALLVYPGDPQYARQIGGPMALLYNVRVMMILPRPTPAVPGTTTPGTFTVAAGSTGPLTGAYEYRLTQFKDSGESYATDPKTVTVTNKAPVLTLPALGTGCAGFRVWRGKAGSTACRWVATIYGAPTTYTDTTPDAVLGDELAPVLLGPEKLTDSIVRTLIAGEWLTEAGVYKSDGSIQVSLGGDSVAQGRNVRVREIVVQMPSYYDPETNTFSIGGLI